MFGSGLSRTLPPSQTRTSELLLPPRTGRSWISAVFRPLRAAASAAHMPAIRLFFKAYVTDGEVRDIVEKREFNRLATNPKVSMADFKELGTWRDVIPGYVKDYVPLNTFLS